MPDTFTDETKVSSQLLINDESSSGHDLSYSEKNGPVQTYAFIDLETSGLSGSKITEFAVIAVSRYDLEKMQTRLKTAIPLRQPAKPSFKNQVTSDTSLRDNHLSQNGTTNCAGKVRRQLFTAASNESTVPNSNAPMLMQGENHLMEGVFVADQPTNKRPLNQEEEKPLVPNTIDVATDTVGLFPRHGNTHYYKMPKLPRKMTKLTQLFNPKRLLYPENEDVTGLNNFDLEYYPILSNGFCHAFKELILNLPKPVCLIAHYGEKCDFPIIMSEFLHATFCQFDWGDVIYADSLEVFKLLDKIETHLEIQEVKSMVDADSDWFLNDHVFSDSDRPSKRLCTDIQLLGTEQVSTSFPSAGLNPDRPELVEPHPSCCTSIALNTPLQSKANDTLETESCQKTPKRVVMPNPLRPCPETPVTPTSQILGGSNCSWSTRNPSPSCSSLVTPPRTPVYKRFNGNACSRFHSKTRPTASKPSLIFFPPNCSFKSMVQIAMNHKEYNLGFPKYIRPFSQCNLYERIFGQSYDAHRAEADCQALLQLAGHYGELFTETVDILKRPMANIEPKMLTTRIVQNLNAKAQKQ